MFDIESSLLTWQSFIWAFSLLAVAGLWKYISSPVEVMPSVHMQHSPLNDYIISRCKNLTSPYVLPRWASSTHLQTMLPPLFRKPPLAFNRELIRMSDGGTVALDWPIQNNPHINKNSPVCIILPGLTGKARDYSYICLKAFEKNFRPVVFNKRGHGNTSITTPKLQSFGDTRDFREVINYLHKSRCPGVTLVAAGVSAGSGLLGSYIGEYHTDSKLSATAIICPGYDAEELFMKALRQPYNYFLVRGLKRILKQHKDVLSPVIDYNKAMSATTMGEFDEAVYLKFDKQPDLRTFWQKNNPMRHIHGVRVPTICISAEDDPVCRKEVIPYNFFFEAEFKEIILVTTAKGGHCGHMEFPDLYSWADKVAIDYIEAVLEFENNETKCD